MRKNLILSTIIFCSVTVLAQVPILNSNPAINNKVIYLDFDGQVVSGTAWNSGNTINAAASTISNANKIIVWKRVSEDYRPFDVNVTTDSVRFNNANPNRRIRVVITPTSSWYPSAGGVAYVGSFTWGGTPGTPCWVFENALGYSAKSIAEAAAHEVGHSLTLRHQSVYNSSCVKTAEYHSGVGSGVTSWAPIMGVGYSRNVTIWHNGQSATGCTVIQNDHGSSGIGLTSANYLSFLPDDVGNTYANAKVLNLTTQTTSDSGLITQPTDIDVYRFDICNSRYVSIGVKPWALDTTAYSGADLDVKFKLYDSGNTLIAADSNLSKLNTLVGLNLNPGAYYFVIDGGNSSFYSDYGSLGKYYISIKATNPPALANSIITGSSVCAGQGAVLNYSSNGVPTSWSWNITGPSSSTYAISNPTVTFPTAGMYTISLLAGSATATSCPVFSILNVQPPVTITVTGNQSVLCSSKSATLTASGATSYTWLPGNFTPSSQVVTPSVTSSYTVIGQSGSCVNSAVATVSVNPPFTVGITASKTKVCAGDSVTITATGATNYSFFPGGVGQNPIKIVPVTNMVVIAYGSVNGCVKTSSVTLNVVPDFTLDLVPSDSSICPGDTLYLTAAGATNYTFNPGGTTVNPLYITPYFTTVYTVTGSNDPLCTKNTSLTVLVSDCNYVGIEELAKESIKIYPNPAHENIYLEFTGSAENILISNSLGQQMLFLNTINVSTVIETATWSRGIYLLTADQNGNKISRKIILE
jgi:hypothetical protein